MVDEAKTFMVEGATLIYKNFSGKEGRYNAPGDMGFSVLLEPDVATMLANDGWNVRQRPSRDEDAPDEFYVGVTVNFKIRPPRVVMITSRGRLHLDADTVGTLDWADIENVDLVCRAYNWQVGDKSGLKAYLQTMFVTIKEDELEKKYAEQGGSV